MADTFVGVDIAVVVVTASIVLAGILIGIGRATGYKRVEVFGIEELIQSIINAAIIGSFAAIIELVGAVSSSVVTQTCTAGTVVDQLVCILGSLGSSMFLMSQQLLSMLNLVGYYQSLSLDFGAFSISPFVNLASVSNTLSLQLLALNAVIVLMQLNGEIASFIGQNALGLLFPVGLVLRTFFATRKVGGFLIALALGLFVFYPTFILIFPPPQAELDNATAQMQNFTNNSYYATTPVVDLNSNYAIAGKLDVLSGRCDPSAYNFTQIIAAMNQTNQSGNQSNGTGNQTNSTMNGSYCYNFMLSQAMANITLPNTTVDFSGDITRIVQTNNTAISKSLLYSVVAPLFSLLITVVFVRELANILGSEIGLKTFASI